MEPKTEILKASHNIIMEQREKMSLSGVSEVVSFEEDNVVLKTAKGELTIRGSEMKMESFASQVGDLKMQGNIYALVYTDDSAHASGGFLRRIFR